MELILPASHLHLYADFFFQLNFRHFSPKLALCVCSIVAGRDKTGPNTKYKAQLLCSLIGRELSAIQMTLCNSDSGSSCQHSCRKGLKAFSVKIIFALGKGI